MKDFFSSPAICAVLNRPDVQSDSAFPECHVDIPGLSLLVTFNLRRMTQSQKPINLLLAMVLAPIWVILLCMLALGSICMYRGTYLLNKS